MSRGVKEVLRTFSFFLAKLVSSYPIPLVQGLTKRLVQEGGSGPSRGSQEAEIFLVFATAHVSLWDDFHISKGSVLSHLGEEELWGYKRDWGRTMEAVYWLELGAEEGY